MQLPLALPTIMAGINQKIMMALAMVVIASMIGVQGLGQPVLKAIANRYFTLGVFNGLAIVGSAVMFGRASRAYGHRLQKHREQSQRERFMQTGRTLMPCRRQSPTIWAGVKKPWAGSSTAPRRTRLGNGI